MTDLTEYLTQQSEETLNGLYTCPWTCQAVLRSLPSLAKLHIMRIINRDQHLDTVDGNEWK